jgi:uncharacterized membrane protein
MRILEIILKLAFLVLSIYFIATQSVLAPSFNILLIVCIMLGVVLLLNFHKPSYKFKHSKEDFYLRHIEGGILILFAVISTGFGL